MKNQLVLILDFGGQYSQLIARRVRELNVYCELVPFKISAEEIEKRNPIGLIFTGGPHSVYEQGAPDLAEGVLELGIPIFGICYGCQLITERCGGKVGVGPKEYGRKRLETHDSLLFKGLPSNSDCWMSHSDYIEKVPSGFRVNCITDTCPAAGIENSERKLYGVQFHPEVVHSEIGQDVLKNFLFNICGASGDWTMQNFVRDTVEHYRQKIGGKKVLCALSGGVDSAVAAALVHAACPNLICVFVDHGLLRQNEADEVMQVFKGDKGMNVIKVDAKDRFLSKLDGVTDPERKRKIIGSEFIRVFEEEAKKIGEVDFLLQGTIYPDVVESGTGVSAVIKSHHNVGGLPSVVNFKEIIEPLRNLFKDEVRRCGLEIGLHRDLVMRQPFPGPGLAIRIIGEITEERLETLRKADYIFREEIKLNNLTEEIWQYFAVLTDIRSVGVMGDARTYDYCLALRAVTSVDGMTADWAHIPFDVLEKISTRIVNEVKHINRIVYDITAKPPSTIEWE